MIRSHADGWVVVRWDGCADEHVYRWGAEGSCDLDVVTVAVSAAAAAGWCY